VHTAKPVRNTERPYAKVAKPVTQTEAVTLPEQNVRLNYVVYLKTIFPARTAPILKIVRSWNPSMLKESIDTKRHYPLFAKKAMKPFLKSRIHGITPQDLIGQSRVKN
jgi:hypothetical protein